MEYSSPYGLEDVVSARSVARHLALSSLAALYRATGRMTYLSRNRVQFLYMHHLFPDEEAAFRRLLRALSRDHHFINYSEAVNRVLQGRVDKPYICLSFDDGLKNCLRASGIMEEFGVSGCFFICPELVGETNRQKLKEHCSRKLSMPPTGLLSWDDVSTIMRDGHEIGSHTMTHTVLARIPDQQMQDEIYQSYERLVDKVGCADHFAWPEGALFSLQPGCRQNGV